MEAKLVVVGGKAKKAKVALKVPTLLGRSKEAGLTISHPMISRRHCEVFETGGLLMIRDLGSLNGTVVGGRRVKESPLPPDAEFTIGPLTFRAEYVYDGDLKKIPAAILAEQETVAAAAPADDEDVFDLKDDVETAPAALSTIAASATPAEADSAFFEEMISQSGNGAAANSAAVTPAAASADDAAEDEIDFFALAEAEQAESAPQPKTTKVASKPAAAKKATPSPDQQAKPAKETAVATKQKTAVPAAAAKKQPAKEAATQAKSSPVDDPSELPDDLFEDLLNGLD